MFSFYKRHNSQLYNKLVQLSRNIFFYNKMGLKDDFQTRVILIFIHLSIILIILKNKKIKLPQEIYDNIFLNIEYNLRELGDGDVAVNKKMKILNKVFYDILLKLNSSDSNKFKVSKNLIKKHLLIKSDSNDKIVLQIGEYLESFYDFCFELKDKNMIKGEIDFKY
tara:strand:- start:698 stop:1195 length:498 start_codon:yes stop_codon:yes gene_type:complete